MARTKILRTRVIAELDTATFRYLEAVADHHGFNRTVAITYMTRQTFQALPSNVRAKYAKQWAHEDAVADPYTREGAIARGIDYDRVRSMIQNGLGDELTVQERYWAERRLEMLPK